MKASELMLRIAEIMVKHGDIRVVCNSNVNKSSIQNIEQVFQAITGLSENTEKVIRIK